MDGCSVSLGMQRALLERDEEQLAHLERTRGPAVRGQVKHKG